MLTIHCAKQGKTYYFIPENDNKKSKCLRPFIEALAFILFLGFVGAIIK